MAVKIFRTPDSATTPTYPGFHQRFVCDLDSEIPVSANDGDVCFSKESVTWWTWDGNSWETPPGGSGAPTDAEYLVASSNAGLSDEVVVTTAGLALLDDADAAAQRTTLGLGTLATQSGTFSGTSSGTNTGDQTISDATISTTDITTNNATAAKHGFLPKLSGSASDVLKGDGTFGGISGGNVVALKTSDQTAIGTSYADVTGTGLAVSANKSYAFKFLLICDSDATTTGIDVSVNGPASPTSINYTTTYWTSATAQAFRPFSAYDGNTAATSSNGTTRAVFKVEGTLRNGSNAGTLIARAKREAVGTGPNVRAGSVGILTPLD